MLRLDIILADRSFQYKGREFRAERFACVLSFIADRSNYFQHMKRHAGEKGHMCDYCGKCFVSPSDLKKHVRVHTGERPYVCTECGNTFSDCSSWKRHCKQHNAQFSFQCSLCMKTYARKDACSQHIKRTHGDMPDGYVTADKITVAEARERSKSRSSQILRNFKEPSQYTGAGIAKLGIGSGHYIGRMAPPKKSWQSLHQLTEVASWRLQGDAATSCQGSRSEMHGMANIQHSANIRERVATGVQ